MLGVYPAKRKIRVFRGSSPASSCRSIHPSPYRITITMKVFIIASSISAVGLKLLRLPGSTSCFVSCFIYSRTRHSSMPYTNNAITNTIPNASIRLGVFRYTASRMAGSFRI
ncbi:MAG: hypothetical protein K0R57_4465 [Paenibacillaceae bacterium]|nr:hypothetical protein [Paenibacillaceae bacterium]